MQRQDYYRTKAKHLQKAEDLKRLSLMKNNIPPISTEDVEECVKELKEKSLKRIEEETAIKWGARYLAAQSLNLDKLDIDTYKHEAIEHASLVGSDFLSYLVKQIGEANE